MALTFVASSAWVFGTGSITPTLPTGTVTGDYVIIDLASKYDDALLGGAPVGWTDLGTAINTGRLTGVDNGNLRSRCFGKIWAAGDTFPALAPTPNNVSAAHATTYRSATGLYFIEAVCVADNVVGAVLTSGTQQLGHTAGDILHISKHQNTDVAMGTTSTTSASSTNAGTQANVAGVGTALGTDMYVKSNRQSFTVPGTTISTSTDIAGASTNLVGTIHLVRLRERTPADFRSASKVDFGINRTTTSVPVPAGAQAGDIAVVGLYVNAARPVVITSPTGFTQKFVGSGEDSSMQVFWKRLTGADTGTWDFTHVLADSRGVAGLWYGRVTTGDPFRATSNSDTPAVYPSTSVTAPSINAVAGDALVAISITPFTYVWSGPPDLSEVLDNGNSLLIKENLVAGETGTKTFFLSGTDGGGIAWMGTLKDTTIASSARAKKVHVSNPAAYRASRF